MSQVEEDVGVVGLFFGLFQKDVEVAADLVALFEGVVDVAQMEDLGFRFGLRQAGRLGCGEHLLVNGPHIAHVGSVQEEAEDGGPLEVRGVLARPEAVVDDQAAADDAAPPGHLAEVFARFGIQPFVGIEHQDPVPRGMREGLVAGGGEIVLPGEVEGFGSELLGDGDGFVRRAGVHQDDLVHRVLDALQAALEEFFLVLGDHAEADARDPELEQRENGGKLGLDHFGFLLRSLDFLEAGPGAGMAGTEEQGTLEELLGQTQVLQARQQYPHHVEAVGGSGGEADGLGDRHHGLVQTALVHQDHPQITEKQGVFGILLERAEETITRLVPQASFVGLDAESQELLGISLGRLVQDFQERGERGGDVRSELILAPDAVHDAPACLGVNGVEFEDLAEEALGGGEFLHPVEDEAEQVVSQCCVGGAPYDRRSDLEGLFVFSEFQEGIAEQF